MPEMRRVTVRFGESLWDLIEDEANRDGVSAAQWIRDASLMRCAWERGRRPDGAREVDAVIALVRAEFLAEDERRQLLMVDVLEHARPELDAMLAKLPARSQGFVRDLYGV